MKVCLPLDTANDKNSIISSSFELATSYFLYDCASDTFDIIDQKAAQSEEHETSDHLGSFLPGRAKAIITKSLRFSAFVVLKRYGIKMFKAQSEVVEENLLLFNKDALEELTMLDLTQGKSCGSACSSCSSKCK